MNLLSFWFICCIVSINLLNAQPASGAGPYVWNPYNHAQPRQALQPRYQLFVGQLPNFWTPQQVVEMFLQATGIEVQVGGRIADGSVFVFTYTEGQRDTLLGLNRRLLAEVNGFMSLMDDENTEEHYQAFFLDTERQQERLRRGLPTLPVVIMK